MQETHQLIPISFLKVCIAIRGFYFALGVVYLDCPHDIDEKTQKSWNLD